MSNKEEIETLIKFNDIHPKDMTKENWLEDFNSFYKIMKDNFPYFNIKERMLGYNWLDLKENYIRRLKKAKEIDDYLEILFDSVKALQDTHTNIQLPHWFLDYFFKEGSFANNYFQKFATYRRIFSEEIRVANEYWRPIMKDYYSKRNEKNFEVLILYSKGKYKIFEGYDSWEKKYGKESIITKVNGLPVDEAIKETYEKDYLYWDVKRKKPYQLYIDPKMFGEKAKFTIERLEGERKEVMFKASKDYNYSNIFKYPTELITTKIWPREKIAYIRFSNFEKGQYNEETNEYLKAFYRKVRNFKHLLIDVRGNGGGMNETWIENIIAPLAQKKLTSKRFEAYQKGKYIHLFRKDRGAKKEVGKERLSNYPVEVEKENFQIFDDTITVNPLGEIEFNAKISILADNITHSAATGFVLFCKDTGFGNVYGVPTLGEGIGYSAFYVLPNSKIVIRFFPNFGLDSEGNACEEVKVQPDIYYETETREFEELIEYVVNDLKKN